MDESEMVLFFGTPSPFNIKEISIKEKIEITIFNIYFFIKILELQSISSVSQWKVTII